MTLNGNYVRVAQTLHVEESIRRYHGPVLLIHGDADDEVPVQCSIDAAKEYGVSGNAICACGPKPMLRSIKEYAHDLDIPAYISLEERMACGVGACLACVCKTTDIDDHSNVRNKRICVDGPVFDAEEVEL